MKKNINKLIMLSVWINLFVYACQPEITENKIILNDSPQAEFIADKVSHCRLKGIYISNVLNSAKIAIEYPDGTQTEETFTVGEKIILTSNQNVTCFIKLEQIENQGKYDQAYFMVKKEANYSQRQNKSVKREQKKEKQSNTSTSRKTTNQNHYNQLVTISDTNTSLISTRAQLSPKETQAVEKLGDHVFNKLICFDSINKYEFNKEILDNYRAIKKFAIQQASSIEEQNSITRHPIIEWANQINDDIYNQLAFINKQNKWSKAQKIDFTYTIEQARLLKGLLQTAPQVLYCNAILSVDIDNKNIHINFIAIQLLNANTAISTLDEWLLIQLEPTNKQ